MFLRRNNLEKLKNTVHLHSVFHSIRFKVNKGWSTAVLLFFCYYLKASNAAVGFPELSKAPNE